ncbi:MAG: UDP-N-acetylmuramoyl-tripeptide--D-alanyl-D-alanine ligase [Flavobacteriaceae bacterium]|nr:UDP-N-acetylmuramoyl-tripeptide--D-alanyl-D-alanine ligase [Flavobacteriaceae bacterium]
MNIEELHRHFISSDSACTDTRKLSANCMFFALRGENFNGNRYAAKAIELGAKFAVVDEQAVATDHRFILVDDVLSSLQELSRYHRRSLSATIIGLTGSNGKTTTKELIYAVLSTTYKTQATKGNYNNHIGVPLTLLNLTKETEYAVVEMGANHQGEIAFLSGIAEPDFGYITNFGKAHLEGFGGIEGVIKGKSELYDHLKKNEGYIFVNAQDDKQLELTNQYDKCILFNESVVSSLNSEFISADPYVKFKTDSELIESKLTGYYNFHNISVAVAIGRYFGVSNENIKAAISNYTPLNNRSEIIERNGQKIILDAYNANPTSMKAALDNFDQIEAESKVAVLGDMFELGEYAKDEHQAITNYALETSVDQLWLVGENFFEINTNDSRCKMFRTYEELKAYWAKHQSNYKTYLIKGSRGMALERVMNNLN